STAGLRTPRCCSIRRRPSSSPTGRGRHNTPQLPPVTLSLEASLIRRSGTRCDGSPFPPKSMPTSGRGHRFRLPGATWPVDDLLRDREVDDPLGSVDVGSPVGVDPDPCGHRSYQVGGTLTRALPLR